jgi:hypothetical protein
MVLQGCYGKMALTKKVYALNGQVSDKFLRSWVTWAFIFVPVYGVSVGIDFILFNTIEFWTGNNPIAQGEKDFQYASGEDTYKVHARKSGASVNYQIAHYKGGKYQDTLAIDWDLKSGNSTALLTNPMGVTEYQAVKERGAVVVTSNVIGPQNQRPGMVARK